MANHNPPKKNDTNGYVTYACLVSQATPAHFQANPTLAAGDVKIAIDDGAPANLGTLPAVDGDFTKRVKVTLSQAETNGDVLTIIFSDAAGDEWCDLYITIHTSAQTFDETDAVADGIQTDLSNATDGLGALKNLIDALTAYVEGMHDLSAAEVNAEVDTALADYDPPTKAELDTAKEIIMGPDADDIKQVILDIAALNNLNAAQVNAQMVDALGTDTLAELGQAKPSATPTIKTALMLIYMALRNKLTTTSTELGIYDDAGTKIAKKTLSDDGVTFTESEMESGA